MKKIFRIFLMLITTIAICSFTSLQNKILITVDDVNNKYIDVNFFDDLSNSFFGQSVAISGNYAIIGAPRYTSGSFVNMGTAYVFEKTTVGWKQLERLAASDSASGDRFGCAVAISGDYAVAGSCTKTVNGNKGQGKIYVYKRSGMKWLTDTSFIKTNGTMNDYFGWSVAVSAFNNSGPSIAVSIPYSDAAGTDKGEVDIYTKDITTGKWSLRQNIIPADVSNEAHFGSAISMDTNYLSIGAPGDGDKGAAYILMHGGTAWSLQQKITGVSPNAKFGFSVSISGDQLAVGAPFAATGENISAAVSVYQRKGNAWNLTNSLSVNKSFVGNTMMNFGMAVAINGNDLVIGAPGGTDFPNGETYYNREVHGTVYFFKTYNGTNFFLMQSINSGFSVGGDCYGEAVCLDSGNYLIGNPHATLVGSTLAGASNFGEIGE